MNRLIRLALAASALTASLFAQSGATEDRRCDTWTLRGTYLLRITGTRPAPRVVLQGYGATPGTIESVTGIFTQVFDGRGGFIHPGPIVVKGAFSGLFPDQPGSGTYQVRANCTGTFSVNLPQLPTPLENAMIIYDGGKRFESVVTSPQALMITVVGTRID
jgi:hypothetical protein